MALTVWLLPETLDALSCHEAGPRCKEEELLFDILVYFVVQQSGIVLFKMIDPQVDSNDVQDFSINIGDSWV